MQRESQHFPTQITHYSGSVDIVPLQIGDTESTLELRPVTFGFPALLYTLPGLPFNLVKTPPERLVKATTKSAGSVPFGIGVAPLDFQLQPTPLLADFRAIIFQNIGDSALVRWTGSLWSLIDMTGTAYVVVPGQTFDRVFS